MKYKLRAEYKTGKKNRKEMLVENQERLVVDGGGIDEGATK